MERLDKVIGVAREILDEEVFNVNAKGFEIIGRMMKEILRQHEELGHFFVEFDKKGDWQALIHEVKNRPIDVMFRNFLLDPDNQGIIRAFFSFYRVQMFDPQGLRYVLNNILDKECETNNLANFK